MRPHAEVCATFFFFHYSCFKYQTLIIRKFNKEFLKWSHCTFLNCQMCNCCNFFAFIAMLLLQLYNSVVYCQVLSQRYQVLDAQKILVGGISLCLVLVFLWDLLTISNILNIASLLISICVFISFLQHTLYNLV